jgi:hypothetical protein
MLLKVLGLICAGVFVAAAVFEVKQVKARRRKKPRDAAAGASASDGRSPLTELEDTACQVKQPK